MKNLGIWIAVVIGFAIYNTVTRADRDESGAIVDAGRIDAFAMQVGDCFNDSTEMTSEDAVRGMDSFAPRFFVRAFTTEEQSYGSSAFICEICVSTVATIDKWKRRFRR